MKELEFTYNEGYVSNPFTGPVAIQFVFPTNGRQVVFLDTRLNEEMPWTEDKTRILSKVDVLVIPRAAEGQQFRVRCAYLPDKASVSPMGGSSDSGGSGSELPAESVGSEQIKNDAILPEDLDPELRERILNGTLTDEDRALLEELSGEQLSDEDIENIFFPKEVTAISASVTEGVLLRLTGKNLDEDDVVEWTLKLDGQELALNGTGTTLELDTENATLFMASIERKASVTIGEYESEELDIVTE